MRQVADGLAFPNGMAVTPDDSTLIVAESFAGRLSAFDIAADGGLSNRRVWAELGEGGDGICLDAEGAVWTPAMQTCLRVREGGEVLERIELDRFCFACMLGGEDRQDAVHAGGRLERDREHRQGPADGQGADGPGAGARRRPSVSPAARVRWRAVSAREISLWSDAIGASGTVVVHGHWGRPVLAFPAERGGPWEFQDRGMVEAVAGLLEAGRCKLYCVDSFDSASWSNKSIPLEARAQEHGRYEAWIVDRVVPWIHEDCGGAQDIATVGVSLGAYHAVNFALKRADLFPIAIGLSGNYDPASWDGWGERGHGGVLQQPDGLPGPHARRSPRVAARAGEPPARVRAGEWEDTTGSLDSAKRLAGLLTEKGLRHELDLWGHDVPHDWPSWRAQLAHHLPRFC